MVETQEQEGTSGVMTSASHVRRGESSSEGPGPSQGQASVGGR